jgi:rhamnose transport system ATP-binding protein
VSLIAAAQLPGADGGRPGVALVDIDKSYGGVRVLSGVSLDLRPGTVHGLVGENGAGKSTLMKVLCGIERPDSGEIQVDGRPAVFRRPADALARGITLISQELALAPARSVTENVFLGRWSATAGVVRPRADAERFAALAERTGFDLDPEAPVGTLPIAAQQQVEILRALARESRVVVMDEPTAALSVTETEQLLALARRLALSGLSIVLVSHFLEEILRTCDTVTVLRDGRHVLTEPAAVHTPATLIRGMVGRDVDVLYPELPPVPADAPVLLRVRGLARGRAVRGVDLDIRAGEILGLAGLVGSGRTETARLIFGADRRDAGTVDVAGQSVRSGRPREAMRRGLAMVPESRKDEGLVLVRSMRENLLLADLGRGSKLGILRPRAERAIARDSVDRVDIRGADPTGPVWTLSGGNQQKVLFAKWLLRRPKVLLVDEPTRGVDVAAKVTIHRLLADLAARGLAVLVISSEIEEVMGLSHRVLVLRSGRVVAEVDPRTATREQVLAAAFADVSRDDLEPTARQAVTDPAEPAQPVQSGDQP